MGTPVVVDAVNPVEPARRAWRDIASSCAVPLRVVEVVCSVSEEHQRRVSSRQSDLAGFAVPTWQEVVDREYEPWTEPRLSVDTALMDSDDCLGRIRAYTLG